MSTSRTSVNWEDLRSIQFLDADPTLLLDTPYQVRTGLTEAEVVQFAEDEIEPVGKLLHALHIRRGPNDEVFLVSGQRRRRGVLYLHKKTGDRCWAEVPCVVLPGIEGPETMADSIRIQITDNTSQKPFNDIQLAKAYAQIMKAESLSAKELAVDRRKTVAYVLERLDLLKLPEEAQAMVGSHINLAQAKKLVRISDLIFEPELVIRLSVLATSRQWSAEYLEYFVGLAENHPDELSSIAEEAASKRWGDAPLSERIASLNGQAVPRRRSDSSSQISRRDFAVIRSEAEQARRTHLPASAEFSDEENDNEFLSDDSPAHQNGTAPDFVHGEIVEPARLGPSGSGGDFAEISDPAQNGLTVYIEGDKPTPVRVAAALFAVIRQLIQSGDLAKGAVKSPNVCAHLYPGARTTILAIGDANLDEATVRKIAGSLFPEAVTVE